MHAPNTSPMGKNPSSHTNSTSRLPPQVITEPWLTGPGVRQPVVSRFNYKRDYERFYKLKNTHYIALTRPPARKITIQVEPIPLRFISSIHNGHTYPGLSLHFWHSLSGIITLQEKYKAPSQSDTYRALDRIKKLNPVHCTAEIDQHIVRLLKQNMKSVKAPVQYIFHTIQEQVSNVHNN